MAAGEVMSLIIAWRNPAPPGRAERKLRRVAEDWFGRVYLVTGPDAAQESFELYPGGATKSDELCGRGETIHTLATSKTKEENSDGVVCGCVAGKQSHEAEKPGA